MSTPETTVTAGAKPQAVVKSIKTYVYENLSSVEGALPRVGLTPEAVARTALSQVYRNPVLETCDRVSLMRSIIEAASLGLSFALGRAYLVPFNNKRTDPVTGRESWRMEATFMPGYQGLVDLVRRSAQVKSVVASAVYKGDEFEYSTNLDGDVLHYKKLSVDDVEANLSHAFCIIRFLDGGYQWVVLDRAKLDKIRAQSKAGDGPSSPWVKWFEEMCIKSAVKRCTKLCPASIELARAIEMDNDAEMGRPRQLTAGEPLFGADETSQLSAGEPPPPVEAPQSTTQKVSDKAKETMERAGVGRPAQCPTCKDGKLRTPFEKETQKCESCRKAETEAIREGQGAAVSASEEPSKAIDHLVDRVQGYCMNEALQSKPDAEMELSALTNGKVQKFDALADYLTAHPEFIPKLIEKIGE